jgi:hypothetical protein
MIKNNRNFIVIIVVVIISISILFSLSAITTEINQYTQIIINII